MIRTGEISHTLLQAAYEKDIGVTFDKELEFDVHMNEKINKANEICAMIRCSYKYLTKKTFLPLYKGLVRSNLEYANSASYLERVQKLCY